VNDVSAFLLYGLTTFISKSFMLTLRLGLKYANDLASSVLWLIRLQLLMTLTGTMYSCWYMYCVYFFYFL